MRIKPGVDIHSLDSQLVIAIPRIDQLTRALFNREAIITSGRDGTHRRNSLHFVGKAIDLRTRDLSTDGIRLYAVCLRFILGGDWDIVVETDHIHVEYDPPNVEEDDNA